MKLEHPNTANITVERAGPSDSYKYEASFGGVIENQQVTKNIPKNTPYAGKIASNTSVFIGREMLISPMEDAADGVYAVEITDRVRTGKGTVITNPPETREKSRTIGAAIDMDSVEEEVAEAERRREEGNRTIEDLQTDAGEIRERKVMNHLEQWCRRWSAAHEAFPGWDPFKLPF